MKKEKILITGGLGFIGSHTAVALLTSGYDILVVDDLSNSEQFIADRIRKIAGKPFDLTIGDLTNKAWVKKIFSEHSISGVIHFAASKAVGESMLIPLHYYRNNLVSLLNLLDEMLVNQVSAFVFSSSCTVYGVPDHLPVTELSTLKKSVTAYGSTKQIGEDILEKTSQLEKFKSIALRYFNPAGAHESALIGELPKGAPQNLVPFITQTAIGKRSELVIFGNDYDTQDGTCIRDYIHVSDLANAHISALVRIMENQSAPYFDVFNIGTGHGTSVLQMINTFEKVNKVRVNYQVGARRPGDVGAIYADTSYANDRLGWKALLSTEDMLRSAWHWEKLLNQE